MVKLVTFMITFDNAIGTYYAGQTVTGKVTVDLREPMQMRGIYINFDGKASVRWTEQQHYTTTSNGRSTTHTRTISRTAHETYFDIKQSLWGRGTKETLAAGHYQFPFAMTLPIYLPTSFEGQYGFIRYYCSANIDRPWKFDPKCKSPFTVLSIVDLNSIPDAINPLSKQNFKNLGCCCCESGPITATVTMNKLGFVPGENVLVNAIIENKSDSEMERTYVVLKSRTVYRAEGHQRLETKELNRVVRGPIQGYTTDNWVNVPMKVPPLPPTGGCQIIRIEYYLVFTVDPPGLSFDLEIEMPIIIGTIPLRMDFSRFQPVTQPYYGTNVYSQQPQPQYVPGASPHPSGLHPSAPMQMPTEPSFPSAPPMYEPPTKDQYPDLPPPSYEECVHGKVDIKDDNDEHTTSTLLYAPRYTYYNQM